MQIYMNFLFMFFSSSHRRRNRKWRTSGRVRPPGRAAYCSCPADETRRVLLSAFELSVRRPGDGRTLVPCSGLPKHEWNASHSSEPPGDARETGSEWNGSRERTSPRSSLSLSLWPGAKRLPRGALSHSRSCSTHRRHRLPAP